MLNLSLTVYFWCILCMHQLEIQSENRNIPSYWKLLNAHSKTSWNLIFILILTEQIFSKKDRCFQNDPEFEEEKTKWKPWKRFCVRGFTKAFKRPLNLQKELSFKVPIKILLWNHAKLEYTLNQSSELAEGNNCKFSVTIHGFKMINFHLSANETYLHCYLFHWYTAYHWVFQNFYSIRPFRHIFHPLDKMKNWGIYSIKMKKMPA